MDHARKAIFNMFGAEPLSYTRFSLARQPDGDCSRVEMKLSAEEEEGGENGMIDHLPPRKAKARNHRHLCCVWGGVGLVFLIGFLFGYITFRARMPPPAKCNGEVSSSDGISYSSESSEANNPPPEPVLYWGDLKKLLTSSLGKANFEATIRKISSENHEAGSVRDEVLAYDIQKQFESCRLDKVWEDEHYVPLPARPSNVISLEDDKNTIVERPSAFVAYSGNGRVSGKPVFSNYGRKDDFKVLLDKGIALNGTVVVVRAGIIAFAEKVANAKAWGAVGVLIYPDPADYRSLGENVALFGHAHLGTGDPYTPGFPSFNHTQFPPVQSSGLPGIPVASISYRAARNLASVLDGSDCPSTWPVTIFRKCAASPAGKNVRLEVNNQMVEKKVLNIFGVIKGFVEPDRYVVIGAQRDAWGEGTVKSAVGTALLLELAHTLSGMVKNDGYKPHRSIIFASWSAGEFGAVGATEWLEGYAASLHLKAFAYINLDAAVSGSKQFRFSSSPLLKKLLEEAVTDVSFSPLNLRAAFAGKEVPFKFDDAARTFIASSGIPSISFSLNNGGDSYPYPYFGTAEDNPGNLLTAFSNNINQMENTMRLAAEIAGRMALRLTHDRELYLDYKSYDGWLHNFVRSLLPYQKDMKQRGLMIQWLFEARGDFTRATTALTQDVKNTDLFNRDASRLLNDRLMKVEYLFLSPYVSPKDTPFRHILLGSGSHTTQALLDHIGLLRTNASAFDEDLFKNQLALLTWTIQGAANALAGDIWDINNEL
ncbi:transferrin receptor protein 1-like isoform X1 [Erythrolamprus reginae]|uniref:transferrin receptor protein 1-like isoform X1 n=1 Tax=Erythrolamprus reginae TaxID=121349 RepID=UPI00396C754A